jgi:hypothetical protein
VRQPGEHSQRAHRLRQAEGILSGGRTQTSRHFEVKEIRRLDPNYEERIEQRIAEVTVRTRSDDVVNFGEGTQRRLVVHRPRLDSVLRGRLRRAPPEARDIERQSQQEQPRERA